MASMRLTRALRCGSHSNLQGRASARPFSFGAEMALPAWGYTLDGRAHVFEDGVLPAGWLSVPPFDLDALEWTMRAAEPLDLSDTGTANVEDAGGLGSGDSGEPRRGRGRPKRIG